MKSFTVLCLVFLSLWQLIVILGFQLDLLVLDTIDETKNALEDEWKAATERVTFSGAAGKSPPKNKFNLAMMQVEAGIREASQFYRGIPSTDAKSLMQKACNAKSYSIARFMFGHFIYDKVKASITSSRGKRESTTVSAVKNSIAEIKAMLGDAFSKMQNLKGGVTLVFAIDTTGSMWNEINSAKKIARYVIDNVPRNLDTKMKVDYILAPFNDPDGGTLPAKAHENPNYFGTSSKDDFLAELDSLPATAGGDCKEMLYKGISDAWTMPHRIGSPIFVFTDAGIKAKHLDKDSIIFDAEMKEMPIYFFLSATGCISEYDKKLYEEIAGATGGQAMYFKYDSFLEKMGGYTEYSITGGSQVPILRETSSASPRRKEYSILADDNMETLNIAATLFSGTVVDVKLYRPDGSIHDVDKTDTGKGSLYMINNPAPGKWKLTTNTDDYYVTGKTSAKDDISFRCFFPFTTKLGRKTFNVTTGNPLIGVKTNMTCEIQAYKKIQAATLKIQIVRKDLGSVFFTMDLEQVGSTGSMFQAEMTPPSSEFRLILEGRTKKGNVFKRKSSSVFKPSKAYMYPYAVRHNYVASKTRSNLISFAVANYGSTEWFDVKVIEAKKFAVWHHDKILAMKGRTALFRVSIKAPSDAVSGQMHNIVVRVVGQVSGSKASHSVQLLIE